MKSRQQYVSRYLALTVVLAVCVVPPLDAQQATGTIAPTQQTATHVDACTPINSQAAGGSQTTLTIPAPPGNQYLYISAIDIEYAVGTALAAALAPTNTTTTNLNGLKWGITIPVTANTNYKEAYVWQTGMRSFTPGTAVTVVGVAATANLTQNINACYWVAP